MQLGIQSLSSRPAKGRHPTVREQQRGEVGNQTDLHWNWAPIEHVLQPVFASLPTSFPNCERGTTTASPTPVQGQEVTHIRCTASCLQERWLFIIITINNYSIQLFKAPALEGPSLGPASPAVLLPCSNSKDIFSIYLTWQLPNTTPFSEH